MKETFRALTSLRLFAALAVVCFHYAHNAQGFKLFPKFIQNCVRSGPVALEFFYVLSGFVLTHAYSSCPPRNLSHCRSFWLARVARLYPAYLLAFALFLPIAYEKYIRHPAPASSGIHTFILGGILALFALQAWTPLSQAWNGPGWSLSVEAFFYLIFPVILVRIHKLSSKKLIAVLTTFWAGMLTLVIIHLQKRVSDAVWFDWIQYNPLFWSPMFLLGIATYRCLKAWRSLSGADASIIGAAAVSAILLLGGLLSAPGSDLFVNGASAPLIAVLILTFSHPTAMIARVAGLPILFEGGTASYVVYILQSPMWHFYQVVTNKLSNATANAEIKTWQFLAFLLLLVLVSRMLQIIIERPAQRLFLTWSTNSQRTTGTWVSGVPNPDLSRLGRERRL